jgi:phosphinothricin acetyltransferase
MEIRAARGDDLPALLALRNHYVAHSIATFDEQPLASADIAHWFAQFRIDGPHRLLVAMGDEGLLGFCSSQAYRAHPAFAKTIETSIYVAPNAGRCGIGSALYEGLFAALRHEPLHRAVVGIALPNEASIALHEKLGYRRVGVFSEYACKRGQYISSLWMERAL